MDFVVRNIPAASLDGAFRIHLAPECMQQAGLTFNAPCDILDEDGKTLGCGISWRAAEKMGASPKMKPARISETLRDAYGIKEGSHVKLQPASGSKILQADKIVLTEVTNDLSAEAGSDDGRWKTRLAFALCSAEAIASGTTFEVSAKKGLKKRFLVESITSGAAKGGAPQLYCVDDETEIRLSDGLDASSAPTATNGHAFQPLSADGIGGLVEQMEALNTSMRLVLEQFHTDTGNLARVRRNWPVILHGYEGTGKSLLLRRMAEAPGFRRVLRLGFDTLSAGTASKNKATIGDTFSEARAHQPSLILMDDLHELVPTDDRTYRRTIGKEMDTISRSQVLVVAATRSLHDVHSDLLGPGRFIDRIELPIPDLKARQKVLTAIFSASTISERSKSIMADIEPISSRTHGFTSRDLAELADVAQKHALKRSKTEQSFEVADGLNQNGSTSSRDHGGESRPDEQHLCTAEDWAFALAQVRPAALREIFFEKPQIKWSDIGGSQPIQAQLDEIIGWPLHHPDLMKQYNLPAQKGMLLYGPPGCSKTLTAQAVAANYDMNFIAVKGAELISMYVGESERSVREIFRKARTARPCIIFFDEIDSIASERDSAGTKGLNVLTTLLNEMDGFESLDGVFVLAATNKPEALDPAIMRPGRFDQHLYLPPPNDAARREILELHLSSTAREDDLDTSKLVKGTAGYTGAEVVAVCNLAKKGAARRMMTQGAGRIRMDDFERALAETPPRITKEMLAAYEGFGKR